MATVCHGCYNFQILTISKDQWVNMRHRAKFVLMGQSVASMVALLIVKTWPFFSFFKMAASAILDLLWVYWDHPLRLLGGLYHSAKLG